MTSGNEKPRPAGRAWCNARRFVPALCALVLSVAAESAPAVLVLEGPAGASNAAFYDKLRNALALLERSDDPEIQRLYAAVVAAPGRISFRQMTDDPATWSNDGDPESIYFFRHQ